MVPKPDSCIIVAEIGVNHGGDIALARDMIRQAKAAGADMAKFQLFDPATIVWPDQAIEQKAIQAQITLQQAKLLMDAGRQFDIEIFFSVFDVERVGWCQLVEVETYKVASSRSSDTELLKAVYATRKTVFQSLPVKRSWKLGPNHIPGFALEGAYLLYCIPEYPATVDRLPEFGTNRQFQGYSDHTIGTRAVKDAILKDAMIVEKHFSLDHETGMDARWSMTPEELKDVVEWRNSCLP